MRVLVTGANGYIGRKVVSKLCDFNFDVIACDLNSTNIDKRAKFIQLDILNFFEKDLFKYFQEPDICLHLAWRDGFKHFSLNHLLDFSSHIKFLENLVSNGLSRLAIMGTMHEVGYFIGAIDENTVCKPSNYYGIAKNMLRESTRILCEQNKVERKRLRAFYIYSDEELGNSVLSKIKEADNLGEKEFSMTSGMNKFDFIELDELAQFICLVISQNSINGIINVCSGKPITLKSKVLDFVNQNNLHIKLNWGVYPERESESPCIYGSRTKLDKILENYEKNLK